MIGVRSYSVRSDAASNAMDSGVSVIASQRPCITCTLTLGLCGLGARPTAVLSRLSMRPPREGEGGVPKSPLRRVLRFEGAGKVRRVRVQQRLTC